MHALNKNIIELKLCYLPVELWYLLDVLVLSLIGTIYFSCRIHYLTFYNKVSVFYISDEVAKNFLQNWY